MKISVITVAYNAGATIADTLDSVAAQTGADFEHIVVDGNSSDNTMEIVESRAHDRLRWVSEPDKGLYDAMNKGIGMATGDLVGLLNADDFLCRTDALATIADVASKSSTDAVCGAVAMVEQDPPFKVRRSYKAKGYSPWMLRFGHMPPHPGFYCRRAVYDEIGGFDIDIRITADFDWMLRFFARAGLTMTALPTTLVSMRMGGVSTQGPASTYRINKEIVRSCRRRGLATHPILTYAKYFAKIAQFVTPPPEYPAPEAVRWVPARQTG